MDLLAAALSYLELGLTVIPVDPKTKKPKVRWTAFRAAPPTPAMIRGWEWDGIGLLTGICTGYVVVDCDTREAADYWWAWRPHTPMVAKTRRGFHFYYGASSPIRSDSGVPLAEGLKYDVRGEGGFVMAPPTPNYRFLWGMHDPETLPAFNAAWRPEKAVCSVEYNPNDRTNTGSMNCDAFAEFIVRRAVMEAPNGRNLAGFRAAIQLRDAGLPVELALRLVVRYQQQVQHLQAEPYTEDEAIRSVHSAYRRPPRKPHDALCEAVRHDLRNPVRPA